uniref:RING-type E3 ubiquitin transferase n=1 Tax=Daucus carota subsp. sativus TaxID=79200 RepID=A0A161ZYY7_DAUCS
MQPPTYVFPPPLPLPPLSNLENRDNGFSLNNKNREFDDLDDTTVLQGQLQQLFHLHDSGVDQSFIDTLPIFNYKAIVGVKNPFDCAVCLCEFEGDDNLRLLPKCSHAFHMECIDTWLLSHSTCPLCRDCLLSDFSTNKNFSPVVLVLDSGSESSREIVNDREGVVVTTSNSQELGSFRVEKSCEIQVKEEENQEKKVELEEKVFRVKLGKFKNVDGGENSSGESNAGPRRCYSMGSFEYVMDEDTSLKVPIRTPLKKLSYKKPGLPLVPGHKTAMSECDCYSRRDFTSLATFKSVDNHIGTSTSPSISYVDDRIRKNKEESFSISKIWLRGKKERPNLNNGESSRRTSSLRFLMHKNVVAGDETKLKNVMQTGSRRSSCDMMECGGSELGCNEENQSSNSLDSQANTQSFTKRTLIWLMGGQNKVVHSSFSTNV